jgi:hypothetical protein
MNDLFRVTKYDELFHPEMDSGDSRRMVDINRKDSGEGMRQQVLHGSFMEQLFKRMKTRKHRSTDKKVVQGVR